MMKSLPNWGNMRRVPKQAEEPDAQRGACFAGSFSCRAAAPRLMKTFPLVKGAAQSAKGLSDRLSQTHQDNPLKARDRVKSSQDFTFAFFPLC